MKPFFFGKLTLTVTAALMASSMGALAGLPASTQFDTAGATGAQFQSDAVQLAQATIQSGATGLQEDGADDGTNGGDTRDSDGGDDGNGGNGNDDSSPNSGTAGGNGGDGDNGDVGDEGGDDSTGGDGTGVDGGDGRVSDG